MFVFKVLTIEKSTSFKHRANVSTVQTSSTSSRFNMLMFLKLVLSHAFATLNGQSKETKIQHTDSTNFLLNIYCWSTCVYLSPFKVHLLEKIHSKQEV